MLNDLGEIHFFPIKPCLIYMGAMLKLEGSSSTVYVALVMTRHGPLVAISVSIPRGILTVALLFLFRVSEKG